MKNYITGYGSFFERALNFSNLQTSKQEDILYSCNCRLLWI